MKRIVFMVLLLGLPMWVQADYQSEYTKGEEDYKKGKYISARNHFMKVLEEKDYAYTISYIRLCNEKIDEQYRKNEDQLNDKITQLEKEKLTIGIEKDKRCNERFQQQNELLQTNNKLSTNLEQLQAKLGECKAQIRQMQHKIDSLQTITKHIKEKDMSKILKEISNEKDKTDKK